MAKGLLVCLFIGLVAADTDAPFNILGQTGYSGEITVNITTKSSLFYWLFQSLTGDIETDTRPLLIWLPGGSGGSISVDLLAERISPLYIDELGNPHFNNMTWALRMHIMGVDFPYGVGYSSPTFWSDWIVDIPTGAQVFITFLNKLQMKYPAWFKREIYIGGQDLAGLFIPAIASLIHKNNGNLTPGQLGYLNLKGLILGDTWVNALQIVNTYDTFAYNQGLANLEQRNVMTTYENYVLGNATSNPHLAFVALQNLLAYVDTIAGPLNFINYRLYNDDNIGNLAAFLNNPVYKLELNVPRAVTWSQVTQSVSTNLTTLYFISQAAVLSTVLNNYKVMIFSSQDNFLINPIAVQQEISNLNWEGISDFESARRSAYTVSGNIVGYVQASSNLTFVQILNTGLIVGLTQALNPRDMIYRFVFNQGWN